MDYINPRWANEAHTQIIIGQVVHQTDAVEVPEGYDADKDGPLPQSVCSIDTPFGVGVGVFNRAVSGDFGPIGEYVAPPPDVPAEPSTDQMKAALASIFTPDQLAGIMAAASNVRL